MEVTRTSHLAGFSEPASGGSGSWSTFSPGTRPWPPPSLPPRIRSVCTGHREEKACRRWEGADPTRQADPAPPSQGLAGPFPLHRGGCTPAAQAPFIVGGLVTALAAHEGAVTLDVNDIQQRSPVGLDILSYTPTADFVKIFHLFLRRNGIHAGWQHTQRPNDPIKMTVIKSKHYNPLSPTKISALSLGEPVFYSSAPPYPLKPPSELRA